MRHKISAMDIDCQYIIPSDAEELKKRHEAEEFLQSYKVEEESSVSTMILMPLLKNLLIQRKSI
ncbi:hypothetical protein DW051_08070 [Bacteroides uniformis]|nr:hypothetical protein DW051_08070 [Bacteroides uniformis]